jgi:sn-glycerol 3-phosphate transport system substrate-binding protein
MSASSPSRPRLRRHERQTARLPAALVLAIVAALVAASCGNGKSILEIGNPSVPTEAPAPPPGTNPPGGGGSGPAVTLAPTTPTTIATTTSVPAAQLPPCPVQALANVTSPVKITFWHAMNSDLEKTLKALTAQYNASQKKVQVTLVNQNGYENNITKYKAASVTARPDLVQMPDYATQLMADSGTVIPVQSCVNADSYSLDDFVPRATAYYTLRGALQGMPFNVSNPVLFYNRAMFVKAGLDPNKPPTTLEELRADSEKLVSSGAAKYGIALDHGLDSGGGWFLEQWLAKANELYANNENGRAAPATRVLFDGPVGVQVMTFLQDMVKDGLAVDVGALESTPDNLLKLADPKAPAAMTINTSAALSSVLNALKAGLAKGFAPQDLGIGPMPGPDVNPGTLVGGAALWIPKGHSDADTAAAWDYIKFLVGPQQQSTWAAGTGYVPVRQSAVDLPPIKTLYVTDPRFKVAYTQLNVAADTPEEAGPILGPQREVRILTSRAVEAILVQRADVKSQLTSTARQSNLLIAQWTSSLGG